MIASALLTLVVAATPVSCGTNALRAARTLAAHAPPGRPQATTLQPLTLGLADRPATLDVTDSATLPLRVHRDASATPAQAALVLQALEEAWALQVDGAGFPPPLPDDRGFDDDGGDARLDVYLAPILPGTGAVTVSGDDVDPTDDVDTRAAFVRIAPGVADDVLVVTAHHEFQHALQFAVDGTESAMWFEATAVAWEVRARPDVDAWQDALPSFQRQPQAPYTTDAIAFAAFATDDGGLYEYGAALFALYVDDVVGSGDGRLLRDLWVGSAGPRPAEGDADDANEPDWIDALDARLASSSDASSTTTLADLQLDFAAWRALAGTRAVSGEGPAAYNVDARAELGTRAIRLDALSGLERTTTPAEGPFVQGCATFAGTAPSTQPVPLHVSATSERGDPLGVVAVVVSGATGRRSATRARSTIAPSVSLDVVVGAGDDVVVTVCDVAARDADAPPEFAPVRLRLGNDGGGEGEGEGEGDVVGEGEGEGDDGAVVDPGCGCDQAPSSSETGNPMVMRKNLGVLGFFVALVGVVVRGVRLWRRRRLYDRGRRPQR